MSVPVSEGLQPYKRTATFTEASVDHSTKDGAWGLIHVEEGRLRYFVTDPRRPPLVRDLTPESEPMLIEPTILHRVEPLGAVRFHVQFLRADA